MSNVINTRHICPVIAGVSISTDAEGRFNLNALHKASGLGEEKAPAKWLRNKQAKELVQELIDGQICPSPVDANKGGVEQGTFAHELLAISYAGWISPSFQLKVNQVFLDYRTGKLNQAPALPSVKDLALMVIQAEEEKERLLLINQELSPKAQFHDAVAVTEDAISIALAAKPLNTGRNRLCSFMRKCGWITRHNEPYQDKITAGLLDVKLGKYVHPENGLQQSITTLVTGKGLTKLHEMLQGGV
ncbi:phage antirepressor KilAC domain-containing protein [Pragia fontium]|uniref:phage antirepressor KilAC domain-containing protein n=1 Tax=Pragia fontium TaxID=82985 RepID=UPI0006496912|nr:phage antirepressor KilAC domain-containing protein [Pragia fontium]AKJ41804.1 hypothetical protein QQ39_06670 [Pragia fontium]